MTGQTTQEGARIPDGTSCDFRELDVPMRLVTNRKNTNSVYHARRNNQPLHDGDHRSSAIYVMRSTPASSWLRSGGTPIFRNPDTIVKRQGAATMSAVQPSPI